MSIEFEATDNLAKMAKLLRDIADGMDAGNITYVPGVTILETQHENRCSSNEELIRNGYFRLTMTYYDKTRDETQQRGVVNLQIHDATHDVNDNLKS